MKSTLAIPFELGAGDQALELELDDDRHAGASSFAPGSDVFIRAMTDEAVPARGSTRGSLTVVNTRLRFEHEQYLSFVDANEATLSYPCRKILEKQWVGASLGNVTVDGRTVKSGQPGYGVLYLRYEVAFARLKLSGVPEEGPVVAWAEDADGKKGHITISFTEGEEEDLQIVVRDICTGLVIAGADVEIDGQPVGSTDNFGRVYAGKRRRGVQYAIRTTADGYKDSDQDALANDLFRLE